MLIGLCFLLSCEKETFSDSPIPVLKLESTNIIKHPSENRDSIIILEFSYTDGDGDIGYKDEDTLSGANFIIDFFEINNGTPSKYVPPLTDDTLNFSLRTPYLTPDGENKSIKGDIRIRIPAQPFLGYTPDSVQFKCKLYDRAGNSSNEITTKILELKH